MKGRRSLWSDQRLIDATRQFVAVTDEVWRLQRGTDAECRHFQAMADQGHFGGTGGTRQGLYVMTPSGKLLASSNYLTAAKAMETLTAGLAGWERKTARERLAPPEATLAGRRWESSHPDDGLVLRSFNADLGPDADRERLNRDHVWFSAAEARNWLGADPRPGDVHTVDRAIVDRLVQFHLVDNVRGQTLPFARAEVKDAGLATRVLSREGDVVTFRIEGSTKATTDGTWRYDESDWVSPEKYPRSVRTDLWGTGRYDLAGRRFLAMDFIAIGERTGRTNLNGRAPKDVGPAAIGWVFELAPDVPAERVAPAFVDVYGAAWIVDPR